MTELVASISAVIATGAGIFYGIHRFFKAIEDHLNAETRQAVSNWLLVARVVPAAEPWGIKFETLLESFFGKRHWTWKCFWRSTACSFLIYLLVVLVLLTIYFRPGARPKASLTDIIIASEVTILLLLPVFNLLPDYLSLWKTRKILSWLKSARSRIWSWALLVIDVLLSCAISYVPVLILLVIIDSLVFDHSFPDFLDAMSELPDTVNDAGWIPLILNAPSAALASIWIWLFFVGRGVLLMSRRLDLAYNWFSLRFDLQAKPLQCVGIAAGAFLALAYWLSISLASLLGR